MHSSTNINCTKLKSTGETATHARVFAQLITAKVDVYNEKHFGAYYTPNGRTKNTSLLIEMGVQIGVNWEVDGFLMLENYSREMIHIVAFFEKRPKMKEFDCNKAVKFETAAFI